MGGKHWKITFFLPVIGLYLWLIGGGFYQVFRESLGYIPILNMTEVSFSHYITAITADGFFRDFLYSMYIAITASTVSLLIGIYCAFRLVRTRYQWLQNFITRILQLGMVVPYLYMVFIVTLLYSRTGLFSRLGYSLSLINGLEDFPVLVQDPYGIGILLVFIMKGMPFVTLFLLNILSSISDTYENVGASLGASPMQILRRIYIPLSSDTIVWALMILLAYDIGAFEVPYLLGSLKPQSLSVRLFSAYMSPSIDSIPGTMTMAVILFIVGFLVVSLYGALFKKLLLTKNIVPFKNRHKIPGRLDLFIGYGLLSVVIVIAVLPVLYMILLSFNSFFRYPNLLPTVFTLTYWENLLVHNTLFWGSLLSSFVIAGTTATLATIIGFMAGRGIALYFREISSRMLLFISLPLFIPGMSLFLGVHQALIHSPLVNSWLGVVMAHLLISIPYSTNIAVAYFKGIPLELEQAAKNLGAAWPTSMRRLILPMIMPGLVLSFAIAFLISNTEYFATFLVGGGNTVTLSMIMYPYIANSDYGMGAVAGITFIMVHLLFFGLLDRFVGRRFRHQALYSEN